MCDCVCVTVCVLMMILKQLETCTQVKFHKLQFQSTRMYMYIAICGAVLGQLFWLRLEILYCWEFFVGLKSSWIDQNNGVSHINFFILSIIFFNFIYKPQNPQI